MGKRPQNRLKRSKKPKKPKKLKKTRNKTKKIVRVKKTRVKKKAAKAKPLNPKPTVSGGSAMSLWNKLNELKVRDKDGPLKAFVKIVKEVEKGKYDFKEGVKEKNGYYIVDEAERNGSSFVHVVPSEAYDIFEEMRVSLPDSFIGFSMLMGKVKKKDLRVSCFGIPTSDITKALISKK